MAQVARCDEAREGGELMARAVAYGESPLQESRCSPAMLMLISGAFLALLLLLLIRRLVCASFVDSHCWSSRATHQLLADVLRPMDTASSWSAGQAASLVRCCTALKTNTDCEANEISPVFLSPDCHNNLLLCRNLLWGYHEAPPTPPSLTALCEIASALRC